MTLTRWATPCSTLCQESASITRGTASRGKGRSSPAWSKVTPCSKNIRANASARSLSASGSIARSVWWMGL